MKATVFRAATIVVPDVAGQSTLAQAFNAWAHQERPSAIVHVHYYHDLQSHVRGYQIIYMESADGQGQDGAGLKAASTLPV